VNHEVERWMETIRYAAVWKGNYRLADRYARQLTDLLAMRRDVDEMSTVAEELDSLGVYHTIRRMIKGTESSPPPDSDR
jgi:hypothetical protein